MVSKNTEIVNIVAAKTSPSGARARRKEGVWGRNSAAPERVSPAARASARSRVEKLPFPFRRKNQRAQKSKNAKAIFLRGRPPLAAAGGGAGQFASKKVRVKDRISPQIETSSFERIAPRGREAAALRKTARRFAAKMKGAEKEKRVDLFLFRI